MKKLIFVFVALFMVVLASGCDSRKNTVRYDSNGGTQTEESEQENTNGEGSAKTDTQEEVNYQLAVTSFDAAYLKTALSYNLVKGTVPKGTQSIKVNTYTLQKFIPGQTQWSYIASTSLSTLEAGNNSYIVKTFDKAGDQTDSLIFSIDYQTPAVTELPNVGLSHWMLLLFSFMLSGSYYLLRRFSRL